MMMKKLSEEHYVIVNDSEIKDGDFVYSSDGGIFERHIDNPCQTVFPISKVTHSTQPIEFGWGQEDRDIVSKKVYDKVKRLSLSEVKELVGVVDVHTKAMSKYSLGEINNEHDFTLGYKQALEDNKEKKYTERDLWRAFDSGKAGKMALQFYETLFQPPTEWEVEIVDGKLKLKQKHMENKKQTAVEWLYWMMAKPLSEWPIDIWEQAKQMEKEQKIEFAKHCLNKALDLYTRTAYKDVEKYYKETYEKK